MTHEQYYWFIRRQQLLKAYTAASNLYVPGTGGSEYTIFSNTSSIDQTLPQEESKTEEETKTNVDDTSLTT